MADPDVRGINARGGGVGVGCGLVLHARIARCRLLQHATEFPRLHRHSFFPRSAPGSFPPRFALLCFTPLVTSLAEFLLRAGIYEGMMV